MTSLQNFITKSTNWLGTHLEDTQTGRQISEVKNYYLAVNKTKSKNKLLLQLTGSCHHVYKPLEVRTEMTLFLIAQPEVQCVKYNDTQVRHQLKETSRSLLNYNKSRIQYKYETRL